MKDIKLSIVIPVYNVEKYIKPCIESLYKQGLPEEIFEVILINDGTPDDSMKVIDSILSSHTNITVINQSNQGLSISRNNGLKRAKGNYVLFIDSDDLLVENSLNEMLETAFSHSLDILKADLIKLSNKAIASNDSIQQQPISKSIKIKTGEDGFVEDYDPMASYSVLNLYRREFLLSNNLFFIERIYFEDVAFTVDTYLRAKRFMSIPRTFYIYRQHDNSIMSTMSKQKLLSMNKIIRHLYNLQNTLSLSDKAMSKLYDSIYASLSVNLWYLSHYKSLYQCRKEILNDLKSKVPGLSFKSSIKQRFVSFCYTYFPSAYISIRYHFTRNKFQ